MKRQVLGYIVSLLATFFVSCAQQDEEVSESLTFGDEALSFETSAQNASQSRGGITTANSSDQISDFGVFAYYTGQERWNSYSGKKNSSANMMNNQEVHRSDGNWTYSPLKYWPNDRTANTSFFAWAPYSKHDKVKINTTETPTITYDILSSDKRAIAADQMFDLLTASNTDVNKTNTSKAVKFNFGHSLSRVNIQAKASKTLYADGTANATKIYIKDVRLSGEGLYGSGDIDLTTDEWGNCYSIKSEVSIADMLNKDDATFDAISISSTTAKSIFADGDYLYLIPNDGDDNNIKVTIDYDVVTFDAKLANGYSKFSNSDTISINQTLEQGKAYNFTVSISLDEINFDASVANWSNYENYSFNY